MPRSERCLVRQILRNESLEDVAAEISPNQQRRKDKQQVFHAFSSVIHEKKILREGEDEVVK
jgi:hypothetical protein